MIEQVCCQPPRDVANEKHHKTLVSDVTMNPDFCHFVLINYVQNEQREERRKVNSHREKDLDLQYPDWEGVTRAIDRPISDKR